MAACNAADTVAESSLVKRESPQLRQRDFSLFTLHFSLFTFHSSLIIHFFIHVDYFNEKAKAYALMRFTMARRPLERVGER